MKDEDIKLPNHSRWFASTQSEAEIKYVQDYGREAVRLNIATGVKQRSDAWYEVVKALDEVCPGWSVGEEVAVKKAVRAIKGMADKKEKAAEGPSKVTSEKKFMMPGLPVTNISGPYYTAEQMHEYAKWAIELNQKEVEAKQELRPFDLEAAKRGEPIVTRDGRKAVFVGHDPGADKEYRVVARLGSEKCASAYSENGSAKMFGTSDRDLFMAPKPNRVDLD